MDQIELQILGSGDAFGSGGRHQTCLLLRGPHGALLIDCGASSLIAMKQAAINPSEIGWVLLTHLHGDHFGGVPFLVLDGQFSRRDMPLVVAGPPSVGARIQAAMEVLFPGSTSVVRRFRLDFVELPERQATLLGPAVVTALPVQHASGAPAYALRVEYGDKIIAYSGDTEWTESLMDAARGADLFVCEAYFFEKTVRYHLDYRTLLKHRAQLDCARVILTHMSDDMLSQTRDVAIERAEDGQVIVL